MTREEGANKQKKGKERKIGKKQKKSMGGINEN